MAYTVQEVIARVADHANDTNMSAMTTDELFKPIDAANKSSYRACASAGVAVAEKFSDLTVGIGIALLDGASTPTLPTDLVRPIRLWEKASIGAVYLTKMQPVTDLPDEVTQAKLRYWVWRNGKIYFVGSTVSNVVRVIYHYKVTDLTDVLNNIWNDDLLDVIAMAAAAHYVRKKGGEAFATSLEARAAAELTNFIKAEAMAKIPIGGRAGANG